MSHLDIWAIYRDDSYTVVQWRSSNGHVQGRPAVPAATLDQARALIPIRRSGLVRLEPTGEDAANLVETWL